MLSKNPPKKTTREYSNPRKIKVKDVENTHTKNKEIKVV